MTKTQVLEWTGSLMSFCGTAFVAQHNVIGWWMCALADLLLVYVAIRAKLYGFFVLCFGYLVINIIAGIMWSR